MKFDFEIGGQPPVRIVFRRNAFTGTMRITADGQTVGATSPFMPSTHLDDRKVKRYEFTTGTGTPHQVAIEHHFPRFFAGFRPQTYRLFVDGSLKKAYEGY